MPSSGIEERISVRARTAARAPMLLPPKMRGWEVFGCAFPSSCWRSWRYEVHTSKAVVRVLRFIVPGNAKMGCWVAKPSQKRVTAGVWRLPPAPWVKMRDDGVGLGVVVVG